MLIPKQTGINLFSLFVFHFISFDFTGAPDYWELTAITAIANFTVRTGLVIIIHTHPDFGPQPSSVDLHQLHELQPDLSSAVSIIISPSLHLNHTYSLMIFVA